MLCQVQLTAMSPFNDTAQLQVLVLLHQTFVLCRVVFMSSLSSPSRILVSKQARTGHVSHHCPAAFAESQAINTP